MKTERIDEQAAAWLIRLDQSRVQPHVREEFDRWCREDPRHEVAYVRLSVSWERSNRLRAVRPIGMPTDPDLLAPPVDEPTTARPRSVRRIAAIAASVVLALLVVTLSVVWHVGDRWRYYSTQSPDIQRIVLSDGSAIFLNDNSRVRVRYTTLQRVVQLLEGEANFRVAHDSARPFDVEVGNAIVRAVGTQFTVRRRGEKELDVVVSEGRVLIDAPTLKAPSNATGSVPSSAAQPNARHSNLLKAGEIATLRESALTVRAVDTKTLQQENRWLDGRLWFDRMTLRDVVAMFNERNQRKITIADERIADLRIGGGFAADDPDSFLAAATRTLPVRVDDSNPDVWVLLPAKQ